MCLGLAQKRGVPVAFVIPLFDQFQVPRYLGTSIAHTRMSSSRSRDTIRSAPLVQGALPQKRVVPARRCSSRSRTRLARRPDPHRCPCANQGEGGPTPDILHRRPRDRYRPRTGAAVILHAMPPMTSGFRANASPPARARFRYAVRPNSHRTSLSIGL